MGRLNQKGVSMSKNYNFKKLVNLSLDPKVRKSVKRTEKKDVINLEISEDEKSVIRFGVEEVYDDFLEFVGDGRNMIREEVDAIGQGRIWSGVNAIENGLVDLYGGKGRAVEIAAEMAGLEKYRVVELPKLEDPFEQLLRELTENARMRAISKELGEDFKYYKQLHELKHLSGIQARLPFMFEIN